MAEVQKLTYSILEAAQALHLHINTIRRAIAQGRIKSVKFGSARRILATEVERLAKEGFDLDPPPAAKSKRGRPRKIR